MDEYNSEPSQRIVNPRYWDSWNEEGIKGFLRDSDEGMDSASRVKIRDILQQHPRARLLDAACGPAVELDGYTKYALDVRYYGMDITEGMIKVARKLYPKHDFQIGDIANMPFKDDSFDIVLARHIFEHLTHYEKPLAECYRVAKNIVIVNFFIELNDTTEDMITTRGQNIYNNCYSRIKFEEYLNALKVRRFYNVRNLQKSCFSENEIYVLWK